MQAMPTIKILPADCLLIVDKNYITIFDNSFEYKYFCLFARYQVRGATPQLVKSQKSKGK